MQLPTILIHPNPILRKKAQEIGIKSIRSKPIQNLIEVMKEILRNSKDGVGLAAPQIGESLRLFLVSEEAEVIDKNQATQNIKQESESMKQKKPAWNYYIFINPVIKKFSAKKIDMTEGCLSVPELYGVVRRPEKIITAWYDENGKKYSRGFSKFFARVIQHETDHIDGILFIDRMHKKLTPEHGSSKL